jgi:invasion protein IalB
MTKNIKKIAFTLFGVAIVTVIFAISKLNIATADKENGKKFEDWSVSCVPKNEETKTPELCLLAQQVNSTKDDKQETIALYQVGYFGPKKELKLIQTLPLGVSLAAGTSIISSKNLIAPGVYTVCLAGGCKAASIISNADLKTLLSNENNMLAFMNLEGKQMNLPISVKGLKEGLEYIK